MTDRNQDAETDQDARTKERLADLVAEFVPAGADKRTQNVLAELLAQCVGLATDSVPVSDMKLVAATVREIRQGLECFEANPRARRVTAFGSARIKSDKPVYALAREFGRRLAKEGFMVITGAGPGIMQACLEGAGREASFGVNIKLPFEQAANPIIGGDAKLADFHYFFTRKLFFLKEASAVALFPGGFGTHDEAFETLTLVQTGKTQLVPIVCLDVPEGDYWRTWDGYLRDQVLSRGLIGQDDLALYRITDNVDDAIREITDFYRIYHSNRFLRNRMILRLKRPVDADVLTLLSEEFTDILDGKPITVCEPFKEERDEPEFMDLPRISLAFDRANYGRLRKLINRLNDLGSFARGESSKV